MTIIIVIEKPNLNVSFKFKMKTQYEEMLVQQLKGGILHEEMGVCVCVCECYCVNVEWKMETGKMLLLV